MYLLFIKELYSFCSFFSSPKKKTFLLFYYNNVFNFILLFYIVLILFSLKKTIKYNFLIKFMAINYCIEHLKFVTRATCYFY